MSQTLPLPPPGFESLTIEEQIDYVQSLWDHIAAQPEQVPVPDWHKEILRERLASFRANPDDAKSWEEFERNLTEELKHPKEPSPTSSPGSLEKPTELGESYVSASLRCWSYLLRFRKKEWR